MKDKLDKVFLEPAPKGLNLWTDKVSVMTDKKEPSWGIPEANLRWN